ncbi:MAG: TatD family hydrolase [Akkermansia sp.]
MSVLVPDAHIHLSCLSHEDRQDFYCSKDSPPICLCSATPDDWDTIADWARRYPHVIVPSFGIHPWSINETSLTHMDKLHALLDEFPQAGIGEIGLDQTRHTNASLPLQQQLLQSQLELAVKEKRIVTLHGVHAWGYLLDQLNTLPQQIPQILKSPLNLLIHGWQGSQEMLLPFVNKNCYFSLGLNNLRLEKTKRSLPLIPADRLLVESDNLSNSLDDATSLLLSLRPDINRQTIQDNFYRCWRISLK